MARGTERPMRRPPGSRLGSSRALGTRLGHLAVGLVLGGLPVFAVWMIEAVPSSPYDALRHVPSSAVSFMVPAVGAALAALRLGGFGLAGVLVGGVAGLLLAAGIAGPQYTPHPWDELDGVRYSWFRSAGFQTLGVAAIVGLVAWGIGVAARLGRRRAGQEGPGSRAAEPR